MSIRPPACCRALQRQLPVAPDSVWLSEEHLLAAFQRFCAVSKTTRRYGSFVPGPLEARRRLGKRRMTQLSEAGPTYESQAGVNWGLFGKVDRTQWQWKAPTTRPKPQEEPNGLLPDWLLDWSDKSDIRVSDTQNIPRDLPFVDKHAGLEEEAQELQIQFPALGLQDSLSRWNKFSARFQKDLTLGIVSEESIIRIRDMIWDMGGVFPEHQSTLSYRLRFYKVLWEGLKASKVFTPHDLGANTLKSFIMHISSLPFIPSVQKLLNEIFASASTTQLEWMGSGIQFVLERWARSWLFYEASYIYRLEAPNGVPNLLEAISVSKERLDELHGLVATLCDSKISAHLEKGPSFESRILAVHAALNFTQAAVANCDKILAITQTQKHVPMDAKSVENLSKALANVPQHILLPILSSHTKELVAEERWSHYFRACYMHMIAHLPVVDVPFSLKIQRDLELGGIYGLDPWKAFQMLSHWNHLGFVDEGALSNIIDTIEAGASSPKKNEIAFLIFSLHEQNQDTWGLLDIVFFMLQKQKRYDEIFPILTKLYECGYKVPSIIFSNLVRSLYSSDLNAACSVYQLSHNMLPEGDIMEAYRNPDFFFALIDDEQFECQKIWEEVLRIPWYNPIPHDIRISLPKDPLTINEHLFFERMALHFAHAECRSPGLAFANVNQVLWHLRQRQCIPTANISKAMCHAVITRDIARGGPTSGWIGPTRLDYVLGLVKELEGTEVATGIAELVKIWRQYLTDQLEKRKREAHQ